MTDIKFDKKNYRKHNEKNKKLIRKSLQDCGAGRSIVIDNNDEIIAGNGIYEAAQNLKIPVKIVETDGSELVVVKRTDLSTDDEKRKQLAIMDNSTSDSSEFDLENLQADFDPEQLGDWGLDALDVRGGEYTDFVKGCLKDKFLVPPFSVINAAAYDWQQRKTAWVEKGLRSEIGRNKAFTKFAQMPQLCLKKKLTQKAIENAYKSAVSIFDPVLCEILYYWFSAVNDKILDPFAGGSVRGIVASQLERNYTGLELRQEQVNSNIENYNEHFKKDTHEPIWIIGDSNKILDDLPNETFDMCISCPPYADLEVYSEDPADISNMSYDKFLKVYQSIITKTYAKLKENTFVAWVVSEVRNKQGNYYNFVADTIKCFLNAGFNYYNEIVLAQASGTASMRAKHYFQKSRKVVKIHQNVLIFCKGGGKEATSKLGDVEIKEITNEDFKTL